jgi:hypothetical protein
MCEQQHFFPGEILPKKEIKNLKFKKEVISEGFSRQT